MGGFFGGGPSPAPVYVPPVQADPDAEARKQREEAMSRNRRGRAGMVATSERGVLSEASAGAKTLLGE